MASREGAMSQRRPNMRVQRTRSSPSAPHSPLTRKPLGGQNIWVAVIIVCAALCIRCDHSSPTEPTGASLTGTWTASLTRGPCAGNWSSVTLTLQQSGSELTGTLVTADNQQFSVVGSISNESGHLDFPQIGGQGECESFGLAISQLGRDGSGQVATFAGQAQGRCCGTIIEPYVFSRKLAA